MSDRAFSVAFAVSLGLHLVLLSAQLIIFRWHPRPNERRVLEVVYERNAVQEAQARTEERLTRATKNALASQSAGKGMAQTQIRVPTRPLLEDGATAAALTAQLARSVDAMNADRSVIDLANLVEAAAGNPVLLSYFSMIRERIQQTANQRDWVAGHAGEGVVYISFVLASDGRIRQAAVVPGRSAGVGTLQDVAVTIVQTAAPFPPFPPSIPDPSKTIVVPLEFMFGS